MRTKLVVFIIIIIETLYFVFGRLQKTNNSSPLNSRIHIYGNVSPSTTICRFLLLPPLFLFAPSLSFFLAYTRLFHFKAAGLFRHFNGVSKRVSFFSDLVDGNVLKETILIVGANCRVITFVGASRDASE